MCCYAIIETKAGCVGLIERNKKLAGLILPDRTTLAVRRQVLRDWPHAVCDNTILPKVRKAVADYFAGDLVRFDVSVDLTGLTDFARRVLQACRQIPYGQTCSYGELAQRAGRPGAARAVGRVLGRNPIPLVIPCHRVVQSNRALGGFSSSRGPNQKRAMLKLEGAAESIRL
jgi:methylated-DNA-[protein]-cysteine S-methyltransferase